MFLKAFLGDFKYFIPQLNYLIYDMTPNIVINISFGNKHPIIDMDITAVDKSQMCRSLNYNVIEFVGCKAVI